MKAAGFSKGADTDRLARYRAVMDVLLACNRFHKNDVRSKVTRENAALVGRIMTELLRDGFLEKTGPVERITCQPL
jgi:hypothetical protein